MSESCSSSCSSCSSASSCGGSCPSGAAAEPQKTQAQQLSNIKNVIVVMSGKGGVGKSSFSSLIAIALQKMGKKVGILDGDITGPSIPKLFGVKGLPEVSEYGAYPLKSKGCVFLYHRKNKTINRGLLGTIRLKEMFLK